MLSAPPCHALLSRSAPCRALSRPPQVRTMATPSDWLRKDFSTCVRKAGGSTSSTMARPKNSASRCTTSGQSSTRSSAAARRRVKPAATWSLLSTDGCSWVSSCETSSLSLSFLSREATTACFTNTCIRPGAWNSCSLRPTSPTSLESKNSRMMEMPSALNAPTVRGMPLVSCSASELGVLVPLVEVMEATEMLRSLAAIRRKALASSLSSRPALSAASMTLACCARAAGLSRHRSSSCSATRLRPLDSWPIETSPLSASLAKRSMSACVRPGFALLASMAIKMACFTASW
mmetsp:Transcript_14000/g.37822  ORF Transcript_14000/g.37822 Transcript_14000/m.37822 type:complete len:291 (-) Transcript_14000:948-1820(-)